jgi:hypothetical protein
MTETSELRHYARRGLTLETGSNIEIVDREFDFVRAILPYDYAFTSNSQQWDEAERICRALEGPMSALGVAVVGEFPTHPTDVGA